MQNEITNILEGTRERFYVSLSQLFGLLTSASGASGLSQSTQGSPGTVPPRVPDHSEKPNTLKCAVAIIPASLASGFLLKSGREGRKQALLL